MELMLLNNLTEFLSKNEVKYVHWKSNSRIKDALSGIDDFDLFVDCQKTNIIKNGLNDLGFVRAKSRSDLWQPNILHFIGLDNNSGKLCHLHLHYQLWLGWDYDKCHQFPTTNYLFETSILFDNRVFLSSIEAEYVLLVTRLYLKFSFVPFLFVGIKTKLECIFKGYKITEKDKSELLFLKNKLVPLKLEKTLNKLYPNLKISDFYYYANYLESRTSIVKFWKISSKVSSMLTKRHDSIKMIYNGIIRVFPYRVIFLLNFLGFKVRLNKKTLQSEGVIIAFTGCDGSGKSSNIKQLDKTLSKHFEVKTIHLGKPQKTLLGWFLWNFSRIAGVFRLKKISLIFSKIGIAIDRNYSRNKVNKMKKKGYIILLDRIYLNNLDSMDSYSLKQFIVLSIFKNLEKSIYRYNKIKADLVIVLNADLNTVKIRRPNDSHEYLSKRIESIKELIKRGIEYNHSIIDSNQNPKSVSQSVLHKVWDLIKLRQ